MTVREATIYDIPDVLRMGMSFVEGIGQEPDISSIVGTAEFLIGNDMGVLLMVDNVAMAGALATPDFFNNNQVGATELFWWVDEGSRGSGAGLALLNGLESWARSIGASRLSMMMMASMPGKVGDVYEKNGFRKFETAYVKEF